MEGEMLLVVAAAAVSGLNSYSRNCQEVNEVSWTVGNKSNHQKVCAKCAPEYFTLWFYCFNETSGINAVAAVAATVAARCPRCPHPCVSKGLW